MSILVSVLLTSSVLILVILLLRVVLRGKVSNGFLYALWLVVAVRLLIPAPAFLLEKVAGIEKPQVGSSVSVMNLAAKLASHWEDDASEQPEEHSETELRETYGEESAASLLEESKTKEVAAWQTSEETKQENEENADEAQTDETDDQKSDVSENTEDSHMYQKNRGVAVY